MFVLNLAYDLFKNVLQSEYPKNVSVVVSHDSHRTAGFSEELQCCCHILIGFQEHRLVHGILHDHKTFQAEQVEKVLCVHDPHDIVNVAIVNRHTSMCGLSHYF